MTCKFRQVAWCCSSCFKKCYDQLWSDQY